MKRILTTLAFCIVLAIGVIAQSAFPYMISTQLNENYTPITEGMDPLNGEVWDDPGATIPLGFSFSYGGVDYTEMFLVSDLTLIGLFSTDDYYTTISGPLAYDGDLIDLGFDAGVSESPIRYLTEGPAGNRIFKIEWANAGFFNDEAPNGEVSFINLQLWLYEGSNDFEVRFGPMQINNTPNNPLFDIGDSPLIGGLADFDGYGYDADTIYYLAGEPSKPFITGNTPADIYFGGEELSGHPAPGTVYRFSSMLTNSLETNELPGWQIFPQPVTDALWMVLPPDHLEYEMTLRNAQGQVIQRLVNLETGTHQIQLLDLSAGIYFLSLATDGHVFTRKVIKQ